MCKIIQINPALFSFSGKGTRKKQPKKSDINIKVKSHIKDKDKTTKRALLKYIRNQQEQNFENKIKNGKMETKMETNPIETATFNTDFDNSLTYLKDMAEQNQKNSKPTNLNQTLHHRHSNIYSNNSSVIHSPVIHSPVIHSPVIHSPVILNQLENIQPYNLPSIMTGPIINYPKMNFPMPQHGCLKQGKLPTYRTWQTQTQKNYNTGSPLMQSPTLVVQPTTATPLIGPRELALNQNLIKMSEITQLSNKLKINKNKGLFYPKQKRTSTRTYTVGKSKVFPKISVLVSNKTIRNNISTKTQLLKQVPMNDVKKYLIKHGFIRVGTVAPNDVLRKMYESAILICGNINNHNPDNLLYNYFNDKEHDK